MNVQEKNSQSAQPCGCDPGNLWLCRRHALEVEANISNTTTPTETPTLSAVVRKQHPIASGVLDYFPDALMAVANVSFVGNEQHNPGQPLHWDRAKSTDEADALLRHLKDRGKMDTDGTRHSAKVAWRSLALLQKEIEQEGK